MRPFKALDRLLKEQNDGRRERLREKDTTTAVLDQPTHAEVQAAWEARRMNWPAWFHHVPGGRFCVSYRYTPDRWHQVHRSATDVDLVRWMRDYLSAEAVDIKVWVEPA